MLRLFFAAALLSITGSSLCADTQAKLLPLRESVPAGSTLEVALLITPAEGSHVYYLDPGEMGFPVAIEWQNLPDGISTGPLQFPLPHRVKTGDLGTNGYEEPTHFFSSLTFRKDFPLGKIELQAQASWLACDDKNCIPGEQEVSFTLEVLAPNAPASTPSSTLSNKLMQIPVNAPKDWTASVFASKEHWTFRLKAPSNWSPPTSLEAFSETPEIMHPGTKPEIQIKDNIIEIIALRSEYSDPQANPNLVLFGLNPPLRFQPEKLSKKGE